METPEQVFPNYVIQSNETGPSFYLFVFAYTTFAFFLIAPLVKWSRNYENKTLADHVEDRDTKNPDGENNKDIQQDVLANDLQSPQEADISKSRSAISGRGGLGLILRELDKVASAEYPDRDPDFQSQISGSVQPPTGQSNGSKVPTEHSSGVPSAATTSRLHVSPSSRKIPSLILDVGGRRWKHRRPIGRVDVIQNSIQNETSSMIMRGTFASGKVRSKKGISDMASSMLDEQNSEIDPAVFNRANALHRQRFYQSRTPSYSAASARSVLSSIVDDISPNDAADANDPGRGNIFIHPDGRTVQPRQNFSSLKLGCISPLVEGLLELAAPDEETIRVVRTSFPLSVGAMSAALFRLITAGFISQYLGSESMIAYLLVGLFVRLTSEELSGAIIDALSSFVQALRLSGEGDYVMGQYIQLALVLQLLLGIPLLVVWAMTMESVVFWFVQSRSIATLAEDYAKVIVGNYLIQAVSRTCTVICHISGHEHFESFIDLSASTIQVVLIACIVALFDDATLTTVGYIQVLTGVSASIAKIMFPIMRGWMRPYREGILQNFAIVQNRRAFWYLVRATLPLLVGTILEYGEWEVLTIILKHLGPAEVATWALLGTFWDVLESLTEGIGEAAAIQVAFLLAAAQPERAKKLSYTAVYLAVIQSLMVTSGLYMAGQYLAVLFSTDPTVQNMTNNSIILIGLANITMAFSRVSWSLIGAQGRFRLATSVVFFSRWLVTIPVALVTIFVFFLDLSSVGGSLVVGYATASCALTFIVIRTDWERLSRTMQEMDPAERDDLIYLDDFDDGSSSSDDDYDSYDDDNEEASRQQRSHVQGHSKGLRHRSREQ